MRLPQLIADDSDFRARWVSLRRRKMCGLSVVRPQTHRSIVRTTCNPSPVRGGRRHSDLARDRPGRTLPSRRENVVAPPRHALESSWSSLRLRDTSAPTSPCGRVLYGQRLQKYRVHDGENSRVRADAECERRNGDRRESRTLSHHPYGLAASTAANVSISPHTKPAGPAFQFSCFYICGVARVSSIKLLGAPQTRSFSPSGRGRGRR